MNRIDGLTLVYDRRFTNSYADDNAALPGRMEAATALLGEDSVDRVPARGATVEELSLAHERDYIETVRTNQKLFTMASLAAGGAIVAAELAFKGKPAFACIRPPGHHASRAGAWGHCTFNNLAVALLKLKEEKKIMGAFVIDIDAHTGDGTRNILGSWKEALVFNPYADSARGYLELVVKRLEEIACTDIIAVSAGFDLHVRDVGRRLETADFETLGRLVREASRRVCRGRRFAVLEGGYNLQDLGANTAAFCRGFAGC